MLNDPSVDSTEKHPSPDGRWSILIGQNEIRMSHWISTAYLFDEVSKTSLVQAGNHLWSADSVEWMPDSSGVTLEIRRYPGDAPPLSITLRPVAGVFDAGEDEAVPFAELEAWLERWYETHRISPGASSEYGRADGRTGIAWLLAAIALLVAIIPMFPTAQTSVSGHAANLFRWWAVAAAPLVAAILLKPNRRLRLVVAIAPALALVWLLHPVCDPIAAADLPNFEKVITLEQRSAQGEPFHKIDGQWCQCKSWLSRALFF